VQLYVFITIENMDPGTFRDLRNDPTFET